MSIYTLERQIEEKLLEKYSVADLKKGLHITFFIPFICGYGDFALGKVLADFLRKRLPHLTIDILTNKEGLLKAITIFPEYDCLTIQEAVPERIKQTDLVLRVPASTETMESAYFYHFFLDYQTFTISEYNGMGIFYDALCGIGHAGLIFPEKRGKSLEEKEQMLESTAFQQYQKWIQECDTLLYFTYCHSQEVTLRFIEIVLQKKIIGEKQPKKVVILAKEVKPEDLSLEKWQDLGVDVLNGKKLCAPRGKGVSLDIVDPFPLPSEQFSFLIQNAEKEVLVTGDRSFSEAVLYNKIIFSEVLEWKKQFCQDLIKHALSFDPNVGEFFALSMGLEGIDEKNFVEKKKEIIAILKNVQKIGKLEAYNLHLQKEHNMQESFFHMVVARLLIATRQECRDDYEAYQSQYPRYKEIKYFAKAYSIIRSNDCLTEELFCVLERLATGFSLPKTRKWSELDAFIKDLTLQFHS